VEWADEVVVVDSGSTDGTQELARRLGARVVEFRWNGRLPKKKNWALEHVGWTNDWVLILDADERVSPELAQEIREAVLKPRVDGYFINRRFFFMGKWIRHCGYYPSWNLRLFRHRLGRYETILDDDRGCGDNEVHEHVVLDGVSARLQNDLVHLAYPDVYTWMEKHNRYSTWEAQVEVKGVTTEPRGIGEDLMWKRRMKALSRRLPFRAALRFFYSYVLKQGFRDGWEGYVLCRLLGTYEMLSAYKAREMGKKENGGGLKIEIENCKW
jgi:glycosyltransferase involved in cell wall biosynthesis